MGITQLFHGSPSRIILASIFITILLGTVFLWLPFARTTSVPLIDLFFTATSATCVTGLFTIPLTSFTTFGQTVILVLMQIGGIGLITMMLFLFSFLMDLALATQVMAGQLLELESWKNTRNMLIFIIMLTLSAELIGALFIFFNLQGNYSFLRACFLSIFHAVSFFCNAGIVLFDHNLVSYNHNYLMMITASALMFIGGLGFITWHEIMHRFIAKRNKRHHAFSLTGKIVVYGSIFAVLTTTLLFFILEHNHSLHTMNPLTAFLNSFFNALSTRGAGFLTIPIENLQSATLFMMTTAAFVGTSPGSTGSGIKITTLAIFLATVKAVVTNRSSVEIRKRRIQKDQIYKAIAIIFLSLCWIGFTTFCLLITEKNLSFFQILFEAISAFATLGLSAHATPHLSFIGKIFIIASMIIGRIGSLTLILALKKRTDQTELAYPEERVMLS
jgi:trk system potassium uptake protein TrkH